MSKLVKLWENKNAQRALRGAGLSTFALSLAACGGSSDSTTTTPVTPTEPTVDAPKSLVFTTGIDVLTGGTGNDTFIADSATVSAADQVVGGDGTDTVKVYGSTTVPTLSSVEAVEIHHTAMADMNLSAGALSGVTSVLIKGAEASDKTITIKAGDVISLEGMTAGGANDQVSIAAASTVTAATVNVTDMSDTDGVIVDVLGTGIATLNINENGTLSTSYIDILADTAGVTVSTVNIVATGKGIDILDVDDATTINASSSTAAVNLDTAVNKVTVTTGTGADNVSLDHAATVAFEGSVTLGAGDDTLIITSLNEAADLVDSKVTLDGGAGGADNITMNVALASELGALTAANYAKKGITGFEKITISDAADDATLDFNRMGISSVDFAAAMTDSNAITIANNGTIEYSLAADAVADTATITVSGAADAGSNSDVITLVLNGTHAAADTNTDYGVTSVANVETVNIVSKNASTTVTLTTGDNELDLVAVNAKTINVTGDTALDLSNDALEDTIVTFNAADFTGASLKVSFVGANDGVTFTAGGTTAVTVTGGSFADLITTAGGADIITGGDGIDVITTGAGADQIVLSGIKLAANRDVVKDFDVAKDSVDVAAADTDAATLATAAPAYGTVTAKATAITLADVDITEFSFDVGASADLSASTDGTELLKGISSTTSAATLSVDADGDATYIVAYDGGNAYLYYADESVAAADTALAAADIALVAVFENVEVGALTVANFDLV